MMLKAIRYLPALVMPWEVMSGIVFLVTSILVIQVLATVVVNFNTVVWQGTCQFQRWSQSGDLGMVVDCGKQGRFTLYDNYTIRSYLNNPGALTCYANANNRVSCAERQVVKRNDD